MGDIGIEIVRGAECTERHVGSVVEAGYGGVLHEDDRSERVDQGDVLITAGLVIAEVGSSERPDEGHGAFGLVVIALTIHDEVAVGVGDFDVDQFAAVVGGHGHAERGRRGVIRDVLVEHHDGVRRACDHRRRLVEEGDVLFGHACVATVIRGHPDAHPAARAGSAQRPCLDADVQVVVTIVEDFEGRLARVERIGKVFA